MCGNYVVNTRHAIRAGAVPRKTKGGPSQARHSFQMPGFLTIFAVFPSPIAGRLSPGIPCILRS